MSRWFRFYGEALNDHKVQSLTPDLFKTWVNLLCAASLNDGVLPTAERLSFELRVSAHEMQSRLDELVLLGLLDIRKDKKLEPHNWEKRQWKSDDSKERVRKHRHSKRHGNDDVTVTVTPPEQNQITETDSESIAPTLAPVRGAGFRSLVDLGLDSRGVSPRLKERAEGLGLPVDELMKRATAPDVKTPNAMFRHLAVEKLQRTLPLADKRLLAAALTKDGGQAFGLVSQMLLVGA